MGCCIHRNLAIIVAALIVLFAIQLRNSPVLEDGIWLVLIGVVLLQFLLGVMTLLTQVQLALGVMHQLGALVLLSVMLVVMHRTGARVV